MKNILIINGHPNPDSFNNSLADSYLKGAKLSENSIDRINLYELNFNPNLNSGYQKRMELEPDLLIAIEKIKKSDHIVWFFPLWWTSLPALLKGFIDRTFLPGITFQPVEGKSLPKKLLKGKSSRLVITSDSPKWYYRFWVKRPATNQMKKGTLQYCGISKVKTTFISPIKNSTQQFRDKWLNEVYILGKKGS